MTPKSLNPTARILIVDDDPTIQEIVLAILEELGYPRVAVASTGREALEVLGAREFDLVLMDGEMPEMDGYEAARQIRDPATRVVNHSIPIIAMTGHSQQRDRERCRTAGMNDFLSKPLEWSELESVIARWTRSRSVASRLTKQAH